jgi:hypothetical protein
MPRRRSAILCMLALLGGACSAPDYSAVRDWARTASLVADYPVVAAAALPVAPASPTDETGPAAVAAADGIVAMQQALAVYLAALGTLAADGVLPFREDPFAALARRVTTTSATGATAVATLGVFLRRATLANMQAPEMRAAVVEADPAVQALVAALSEAVATYGAREAEERAAVAAFYAQLDAEAADRTGRQAARDVAALRDRDFALRALARSRYAAVLARVAEGHALLKERSRHMSQQETVRQVHAAEDRLRRAAALLPQGVLAAAGEGTGRAGGSLAGPAAPAPE